MKKAIILMIGCTLFLLIFGCQKKDNSTDSSNLIKDIDGNSYHSVTIGRQTWMVENLRTIRLNDGTQIPNVTNDSVWAFLTSPGYCWYNNDGPYYGPTYGALYNWYAVNTGKLAPVGWRVPADSDWFTLELYLNPHAGGRLKEVGTTHWETPNTGATDERGFRALPAGIRDCSFWNWTFYEIGMRTYFWSTDLDSLGGGHPGFGLGASLYYESEDLSPYISIYLSEGCSVRCIKK